MTVRWTPLMQAVAFGLASEVDRLLRDKPDLETVDQWDRTAWLMALESGDTIKARLLLEHGANRHACGRCGKPPVFFAINGGNPEMLALLIRAGVDVAKQDQFGTTALMHAAECGSAEYVSALLAAGTTFDLDQALDRATTRETALALLDAGADPAKLPAEAKRAILGLPPEADPALLTASVDDFLQAPSREFGTCNPQRMTKPFWVAMIRAGVSGYQAGQHYAPERYHSLTPIWCASRFGQSLTFLPDGRLVQIGGEHEDFYDPDFCIYNDVFVHDPDGTITIIGYPEADFPPTDFHTATLLGNFIYVIGSLGYQDQRRFGTTPVYRLNLDTFRIERVDTTGDNPGWIHGHRAAAANNHEIRIWSGVIARGKNREETHEDNTETFVLDVTSRVWRRTPDG